MMYEKYESPLSSRYASEEMLHLFSQESVFGSGESSGLRWPGRSMTLACPLRQSRWRNWKRTSMILILNVPRSGKRKCGMT